MQGFVKSQHNDNNDEDLESDIEEEEGQEDSYNEDEESEQHDLLDVNGNKAYSAVQVEDLLSRCLAAISNRGSISSRSVLSGEKDVMTMQVDAMFKNGTTPANNKDWQRLFLGVLRRSFEIEDVKFLRSVAFTFFIPYAYLSKSNSCPFVFICVLASLFFLT
jgi:hypothetical protein